MPAITLAVCKAREPQFRAMTRAWIIKVDKGFQATEKQARKSKPLRHPRGQSFERHTREYLWLDALWCQDRGFDPFEEFYETSCTPNDEDGGPLFEYAVHIFDEEFRAVMPKSLHHVLEG